MIDWYCCCMGVIVMMNVVKLRITFSISMYTMRVMFVQHYEPRGRRFTIFHYPYYHRETFLVFYLARTTFFCLVTYIVVFILSAITL